jgi:hypothetical protein
MTRTCLPEPMCPVDRLSHKLSVTPVSSQRQHPPPLLPSRRNHCGIWLRTWPPCWDDNPYTPTVTPNPETLDPKAHLPP